MQSNTCCTHMQASDALFRPMRTTQGRVDVLGHALPLNVLRRYFEKVFLGQDQTYCTAEDIFFIGNQEFKCRRIGVGREALLRSGACRHIVQSCVCRHVCAGMCVQACVCRHVCRHVCAGMRVQACVCKHVCRHAGRQPWCKSRGRGPQH